MILTILLIAACALVITLIASYDHRDKLLSTAVGATAGLQAVQIARVHVFCFAVAIWLILGVDWRVTRHGALSRSALILGSVILLASTVFFGRLVNNELLGIQLLLLALAAVMIVSYANNEHVNDMLKGLLLTISLACALALLEYIRVIPSELFFGQRRPTGIYSEPDWLGMFSALTVLIGFSRARDSVKVPLLGVAGFAVLVASARAAWLALGVTVAVLVVFRYAFPHKEKLSRTQAFAAAGVLLAIVASLSLSSELRQFATERLEGAIQVEGDVSATARIQQRDALLQLEDQAPWYGLGLSAAGRVEVSGEITLSGEAENNVASNWILGWWVDGKFLALPIILLFALSAILSLRRLEGACLTLVLIASFFSNALVFPISWFLLALCIRNIELPQLRDTSRAGWPVRPTSATLT